MILVIVRIKTERWTNDDDMELTERQGGGGSVEVKKIPQTDKDSGEKSTMCQFWNTVFL